MSRFQSQKTPLIHQKNLMSKTESHTLYVKSDKSACVVKTFNKYLSDEILAALGNEDEVHCSSKTWTYTLWGHLIPLSAPYVAN